MLPMSRKGITSWATSSDRPRLSMVWNTKAGMRTIGVRPRPVAVGEARRSGRTASARTEKATAPSMTEAMGSSIRGNRWVAIRWAFEVRVFPPPIIVVRV